MGLAALAIRLYEDKLPEEAIEFAEQLRSAVRQHRNMLSEAARQAGVPMKSDLKDYTIKIPDVDWEFQLSRHSKQSRPLRHGTRKSGACSAASVPGTSRESQGS